MPRKASTKKTEKKEPAKPVAQRRSAPKKTTRRVEPAREEKRASSPHRPSSFNVRALTRKQLYLVVGIVIFLVAIYALQLYLVVARVNGQPISRWELVNELQKQQGKQVLDQLVTQKLIKQQAAKQHVSVSDAEVNNEMKTVETQVAQSGQTLDQALASQGMTLQDLKDNIRMQLLAQKMATKNITVSDKEVSDYIAKNKNSLPTDLSDAEQKKQVKATLLQQKQQTALQNWVENLRSKASVNYQDKSLAPQS